MADHLTQCSFLSFRQVTDAGIGIDTRLFEDLGCAGAADTVDIGQADLNALVLGQVNAGNTCHKSIHLLILVSACAWDLHKSP